MATIPTTSHGAYPQSSRRTYMSIRPFNGSFFAYTTTRGGPPTFTVTGDISQTVTGANSTNCPAGRTLRETGKKLFPGANPGVSTYMVGVYDANSGLSGFIDPNDAVFTVYNTDKPTYLDDGVSPTNSATDKAPGVYAVGDIVTTAGNVIAGGQIRSSTVTTLTSITANGAAAGQNIDASLGQVFSFTASPPSGVASITLTLTNPTAGARVTLVVAATTVQNTTITFAGTKKTGTLVVTAAAGPTTTQYYTISFVSDGSTFYETGRTAAQI